MTDSKNGNFRIILALTSLPQDINLTGASLKVTLANLTKTIPLSSKEATPLDFSGVQTTSKIEFGLEDAEGFMFGYSELKLPAQVFEKNETEVNEQLRFYLINKEKDSFSIQIYAIFLNKGLFKEKAKERGVLTTKTKITTTTTTATKSPIGTAQTDRQRSKSPVSTSPVKRSNSKGKSGEAKTTEKNFQAYLNRLVDSHSVHLKSLVDEHNSINEYIHLNKVQNNLPQNFAHESLETYSPTRLKHTSANVSKVGESAFEAGSPLVTSQYRVNESQVVEKSVLRDLSPLTEKAKKSAINPEAASECDSGTHEGHVHAVTEESAPQQEGTFTQAADAQAGSPLRFQKLLENKFEDCASPVKRKQIIDVVTTTRKEIPDAIYYNAQIVNLNNVIVNQNARITDLEVHRKENDVLRATAERSDIARKGLQESVLETTNELKQENKELEKQISSVITEKENLIKKVTELQNTISDLHNVVATTKTALQEKEDINAQNALKLTELNDLKQLVKKLQESHANTENQRLRDQASFKATIGRFEESLQETKRTIDTLNQEKKKLIIDIHQVQQELGLERANHQATQNELLITKKRLENAENYREVIASLEVQRDQLTQQLAESRSAHAQTQHLLQESVETLAARQREFEVNERNFNKDVNNLGEKLSNSETRNERLGKELNEQRLKVSQLSTTVSSLEQLVCVKDDIKKQLETSEKQAAQLLEDRKAIRAQLDAVTITQDQANSRLLEAERSNNQLRQVIEEQNTQIEQLTLTIIALRESQEMYLPIKGDQIDNAVADYINTSTDLNKLKLLFVRETEGVYQFGSKKLYVKLEGGKVLIRVGGGFLGIEEFLDQYGHLEVEKLTRTDPLKKLSKNIAVNKALIGKCVSQIGKTKDQAYEYRTDSSNIRIVNNSSPTLQKTGSREY